MYGKLFETMYDGTLSECWEALIVFQQMIILCDADGVVDITPAALHRRTGIPMDVIERGIRTLEAPDHMSRTSTEDGRRIMRLSPDRSWGWRIVNHAYYRSLGSREEKLTRDRERQRRKRAAASSDGRSMSRSSPDVASVAKVAHTDTDTDTDTDTSSCTIARSAMFDEFWESVHLKVGKRAAEKAFKRAVAHVRKQRRVSSTSAGKSIITAMKAFSKTNEATPTDRTPIHPTTWLNQGRYEDVLAVNATDSRKISVDDFLSSDDGGE